MHQKDNGEAGKRPTFAWNDLKAEIERQDAAQLASANGSKSASLEEQPNESSLKQNSFWQDLEVKGEVSSAPFFVIWLLTKG